MGRAARCDRHAGGMDRLQTVPQPEREASESMNSSPPKPSWRKPAGVFLILLLIAAWAMLVAVVAGAIGPMHWLLELVYYVFAGVAWIAPLKPLLRWMETGHWKAR